MDESCSILVAPKTRVILVAKKKIRVLGVLPPPEKVKNISSAQTKSHFLSWKGVFSSLSEWALPMPETKIWDHFSIQIYPLLVGNMASETTFGHWKVVFSWGKGRKMTFSQNPLKTRFWASGFWMSILSSANFKKDPPWKIFFLSVHAPATSVLWGQLWPNLTAFKVFTVMKNVFGYA